MIIKKLAVKGFGRFSDRTFEFHEGINIVTGPNEAGKSTIHKYIEAMFYGFFKPHTKTRQYEDGYERYKPWFNEGFGGSLTLEDGSRTIRIERNFTKGSDELNIFDEETGEEISAIYDYNRVYRQVDPGLGHFGFNKTTYKNTVSITQMAHRTDEAMVAEIKDNMSNLASSHQSTISVDKVISRIDTLKNTIGSSRKPTSPYYKCLQRLEQLEAEKEASLKAHHAVAEEKVKERDLRQQLAAIEKDLDGVRRDQSSLEAAGLKKTLEAGLRLQEAILSSEKILAGLAKYQRFTAEAAEALRHQKGIIDGAVLEEQKLEERQQELMKVLEKMREKLGDGQREEENLARDFEATEKAIAVFDEQLMNLRNKETQQQAIRHQKEEIEEVPVPGNLMVPLIVLSLIGVSAIYGALTLTPFLWGMVLIAGGIGLFLVNSHQVGRKAYSVVEKKKGELEERILALDDEIQNLGKELKDILARDGFENYEALKTARDKLLSRKTVAEAVQSGQSPGGQSLEEGAKDLDKVTAELAEQRRYLTSIKEQWSETLAGWGFENPSQITEGLKGHMAYMEEKAKLDQLRQRLEDLLEGRSLEEIKERVSRNEVEVTTLSGEELNRRFDDLTKEKVILSEGLSASVTAQNTIMRNHRPLATVEEEMASLREEIGAYDHELAVCQLMKSTIEAIAEDIQNNFAPSLNHAMSKVVSQVTDNRYTDIKVNPLLALTVYDKENHKTVPGEALSAGTIDALYFGLRMAVSQVLASDREHPLILDDPFVQFDDQRMKGVMDLLGKSGRQVLLFTCHQREMAYLEEAGIPYRSLVI